MPKTDDPKVDPKGAVAGADPEPDEDPARTLAAVVPIDRDDDPEPDEVTGGDRVQLVRNGWVRFVIAGHGRVRLRPARFGQLRQIMEAQEDMLEAIQERADEVAVLGERLKADEERRNADPDLTPEDRERARRAALKESRIAGRTVTHAAQVERAKVWRTIHGMLGVEGEEFPDDDDLPVWMLDATCMNEVIAHWQSVPLDRGPA